MKNVPTRNAHRKANAAVPMDGGDARMLAYLKKTQPAFKLALAKARGLGTAAHGVLAGPTTIQVADSQPEQTVKP